jgi:mRNA interferase RelE/StbE
MGYAVEYEPEAIKDLKRLTPPIRKRIVAKINWLASNFEQVQPLPLSANLAGFYRAHLRSLELSGNLERTLLYCNPHGLFQ